MNLVNYLLTILISLAVGLGGFVIAFKLFDWITPNLAFEMELKNNNISVAIFLAGLFIGLGLLLGSAVK
ncbi:MAG: DUF350 domain-containing protein [Acidobacteriota bacterium]